MNVKPRSWSWMLLFTTSATLTCCALPILLVTLGLGTVVASVAGAAPWLITLSMYKGWMFSVSGLLIALSAWAVYRPGRTCPADPDLAEQCEKSHRWNLRFFQVAAAVWMVGAAAAYLSLPIYLWLGE